MSFICVCQSTSSSKNSAQGALSRSRCWVLHFEVANDLELAVDVDLVSEEHADAAREFHDDSARLARRLLDGVHVAQLGRVAARRAMDSADGRGDDHLVSRMFGAR